MIGTIGKRLLATVLSFLVVVTTTPLEVAAQQAGYPGKVPPCLAMSCKDSLPRSRFTRIPW